MWAVLVSAVLGAGLVAGFPAPPAQATSTTKLAFSQAHPIRGEKFTISGRLKTKIRRTVILQLPGGKEVEEARQRQDSDLGGVQLQYQHHEQ